MPDKISRRLAQALESRSQLNDVDHGAALRLFAGFYEGFPKLIVDLYAQTLLLFNYNKNQQAGDRVLNISQDFYLSQFPWIECVIVKNRNAPDQSSLRGRISYGASPTQQIEEHGITYAIDLLLHQDSSFYLDTRNLRKWLFENAASWQVLNTFAYTGSLGVAALAGGALRVIQTDRSKKFLALARQSAMHNRLDLGKMKLRAADFFSEVSRLKRERAFFDCVILDPPYFSSTSKGTVDLVNQSTRQINKVRPLIKDGGWLVTINNALFLSGQDYVNSLEVLCQDGYLSIEAFIPIPEDITGFPETIVSSPPTDPSPFNHPTKIVLLRVKRR
jgi:23S rRNA (cytosine1962-C5)-methyltransferase